MRRDNEAWEARVNSLTGRLIPTSPDGSDALMREILKMKDIDLKIDNLSLQSLSGKITQIPSSVHYSWDQISSIANWLLVTNC